MRYTSFKRVDGTYYRQLQGHIKQAAWCLMPWGFVITGANGHSYYFHWWPLRWGHNYYPPEGYPPSYDGDGIN